MRPRPGDGAKLMLLRSIRSQLLGLVLATVVPFTALIGFGVWKQWQDDQTAAIQRAVSEARLVAVQVDDHIGNLQGLLTGLARAVSTDPADVAANDALLRRAKAELPQLRRQPAAVLARRHQHRHRPPQPDVSSPAIANTSGKSWPASAWRSATSSAPARSGNGWSRSRARSRIESRPAARGSGRRHLAQAFPGRISDQGPAARQRHQHRQPKRHRHRPQRRQREMDRTRSQQLADVTRHLAAKDASEVAVWPDGVERITGLATAHFGAMAGIGRAADRYRRRGGRLTPGLGRAVHRRRAGGGVRHRLDAVGPHRPPAAAAQQGRIGARSRRAQPSQRDRHPRRSRSAGRQLQPDGASARTTRRTRPAPPPTRCKEPRIRSRP